MSFVLKSVGLDMGETVVAAARYSRDYNWDLLGIRTDG